MSQPNASASPNQDLDTSTSMTPMSIQETSKPPTPGSSQRSRASCCAIFPMRFGVLAVLMLQLAYNGYLLYGTLVSVSELSRWGYSISGGTVILLLLLITVVALLLTLLVKAANRDHESYTFYVKGAVCAVPARVIVALGMYGYLLLGSAGALGYAIVCFEVVCLYWTWVLYKYGKELKIEVEERNKGTELQA